MDFKPAHKPTKSQNNLWLTLKDCPQWKISKLDCLLDSAQKDDNFQCFILLWHPPYNLEVGVVEDCEQGYKSGPWTVCAGWVESKKCTKNWLSKVIIWPHDTPKKAQPTVSLFQRTPDNAHRGLESGPPTLIPFIEGGLGTSWGLSTHGATFFRLRLGSGVHPWHPPTASCCFCSKWHVERIDKIYHTFLSIQVDRSLVSLIH